MESICFELFVRNAVALSQISDSCSGATYFHAVNLFTAEVSLQNDFRPHDKIRQEYRNPGHVGYQD